MTKGSRVLERPKSRVSLSKRRVTTAKINNPKRLFVAIHEFDSTCFPVRVRCLLPFLIWPDGAGVLYDRSVFAKLTVRKNRKDRDVS